MGIINLNRSSASSRGNCRTLTGTCPQYAYRGAMLSAIVAPRLRKITSFGRMPLCGVCLGARLVSPSGGCRFAVFVYCLCSNVLNKNTMSSIRKLFFCISRYFRPALRRRKWRAGVKLRMRTCFSVGDWSTEDC